MNKSKRQTRAYGPFDDSARARLLNMGVLREDGEVRRDVMAVFAGIFTGLFFDDLGDRFSGADDLRAIYETFAGLCKRGEYRQMYLYLAIQYDYIGKPLPDPLWWIAGNTAAVKEFMTLFLDRYKSLLSEAEVLPGCSEGDA